MHFSLGKQERIKLGANFHTCQMSIKRMEKFPGKKCISFTGRLKKKRIELSANSHTCQMSIKRTEKFPQKIIPILDKND